MSGAMAKLSTRGSFIIHVYRYDPEDSRSVAGRIEALDGSGASESFTDADTLGAIMNRLMNRRMKGRSQRRHLIATH